MEGNIQMMKKIKKGRRRTFTRWLRSNWSRDNLCPPPLEPQKAINFIADYLLEDWYSTSAVSVKQTNTEIVHEILLKYSKRYRKELKDVKRRCKNETKRSSRR